MEKNYNELFVQLLNTIHFNLEYCEEEKGYHIYDTELCKYRDIDGIRVVAHSASEVVNVLTTFVEDSFINDLQNELQSYGLVTEQEELPETLYDLYVQITLFANEELDGNGAKFWDAHKKVIEMVELILYHIDEVNLDKIYRTKTFLPLYKNDITYARENHEKEKRIESHKENIRCARAIDEALKKYYANNHLETGKVLEEVLTLYGNERVSFVLAAQVYNHDWDNRYHRDTKAWAKKQMNNFSASFKEESKEYYLTAHPILIDAIATVLFRANNQ